MGVVYEAEQLEPVRRRVALKMMKVGMDTREVVTRFEAERQALAAMDHPAVAKVFDAGATEQGRPYFVMELVEGQALIDYCDAHRLTVRDRVALFADVCRGVQHAHQRGLIHRDLKPSNVLVTEVDDRPTPKVIDFGIAKATEETADTGVTRAGHMLGTPAYMSPEQAEGGGADLDVRTDVYSLGMLLYEVLAGALPFTEAELSKGGFQFVAHLLTAELPRPSVRLPTIAETQQTLAGLRRTTPEALRRDLGGDLDWVVMKAIEKDRDRRYASVGDLLRDLEAFLRHEPVDARPPTFGYRASKFVRRHRAGVAAAGVALVALVGGTVAATSGLLRARAAESAALLEAQASAEVADFMTGLFEVSDPSEARGNTVTARELLDAGAERIRTELGHQPRLQARMMFTMGDVYVSLLLMEEAEELLTEAVAIREREFGPSSVEVAEGLVALGRARNALSSQAGNEAIDRARQIYEERLGPDALEVADALTSFTLFYGDSAKLAHEERALQIRRRHLDDDDPVLGGSYLGVGATLAFLDQIDSAEVLYRKALEIFRRTDDPGQTNVLTNLAITADKAGRKEDARRLYDEAVRVTERFYGEESVATANVLGNRSIMEFSQGDTAKAERTRREAVRRLIDGFGPDATNLDWHYFGLDYILRAQQKWSELEDLSEEMARYYERAGASPEAVAGARVNRAAMMLKVGRSREALALLQQVLPVLEEAAESFELPTGLYVAALAAEDTGQDAIAEDYFQRAIEAVESTEYEMLMSYDGGLMAVPTEEVLDEVRNAYATFRAGR